MAKLTSHPPRASDVQQLSILSTEQDKLKAIFVSEVCSSISNSLWEAVYGLDPAMSPGIKRNCRSHFDNKMTVKQLVEYFQKMSVRTSNIFFTDSRA